MLPRYFFSFEIMIQLFYILIDFVPPVNSWNLSILKISWHWYCILYHNDDMPIAHFTLRQMKMKWQSKNRSKSVGHIFNQFNAFWVLLCILINILSLFLFITSRKIFRGDQFGHYIYINELKMGESFSTEKMVSFH